MVAQDAEAAWKYRQSRNLYLGNHPPSEETKSFITDMAGDKGSAAEQAIKVEFKRRRDLAIQQKSPGAEGAAWDYARKELADLAKNPPEKAAEKGLEKPTPGSKGTTFSGVVTQMRAPGGPAQYQLNVRVHEVMHLMGLKDDHRDLRPSVMSYPYLGRNKTTSVLPQPDDIEQLVNVDNPPR